uniref:Tetraspanin n=1 Tax=Macrostomum lignano TaxID=282301 RepID=A0A1I8GFK8_9PLAT
MGCGSKLASITLFVFTIVFFLVGLALLSAGIWMLVSQDKLFNMLNLINQQAGNNPEVESELLRLSGQKGIVSTAGAILIAVGALSAFISLFGCLGAVRQSKCLLGINKYLISVNDFVNGTKKTHTAVSLLFNYMFVAVDCCGVNVTGDARNSESWLTSNRTWLMTNGVKTNMKVPAACCVVKSDKKAELLTQTRWSDLGNYLENQDCPVTEVGFHQVGCVDAVVAFIDSYSLWVIIGCGVFAAAQLLVIIFTLCLICSIDSK